MFNIGDKFIQVPYQRKCSTRHNTIVYCDYEVYHVIGFHGSPFNFFYSERPKTLVQSQLVLLKEGQTNYKYVGETHIKDCVDRGLLEYVKKGDHFIRRHKLV